MKDPATQASPSAAAVHPPASPHDVGAPPAPPRDARHSPRPFRRFIQKIGPAGPVALIATVLPIAGSIGVLTLGPLAAYWLRGHGTGGAVVFTLSFMFLGAVALAPTYTTSMIAGWAFGFRVGFPAVLIGTVGGALLCYVAARRLAADRVASSFEHHPKWEVVRRALVEETAGKTLWIVFLLRLSPVLPFGTTNVLLATTRVRVWIYTLGTILGLVPRLGLVAMAAAGAERLDFASADSWWMLAGGLLATGLFILVMAVVGKRALDRATRGEQLPAQPMG